MSLYSDPTNVILHSDHDSYLGKLIMWDACDCGKYTELRIIWLHLLCTHKLPVYYYILISIRANWI